MPVVRYYNRSVRCAYCGRSINQGARCERPWPSDNPMMHYHLKCWDQMRGYSVGTPVGDIK